ncbi:hypothetical protein AB0B31_06170 [Catellatospora citrea]|uniref:hypothetical protein n=1 Tax=Catellatospora citrea TaxID=53366 RepID=UPI00340BB9F4
MDAVVLARILAPSTAHRPPAGAVATALATFEASRRDRTAELVRMEQSNRDAKTSGLIAATMRDLVMPHVFNRLYEQSTAWLYDFDPGTLPATA